MKLTHSSNSVSVRNVFTALALATTMSLGQAGASPRDIDGDGTANSSDADVDGDGKFNGRDRNVDGGVCLKGRFKGKFVGDRLKNDDPRENDIDGDGRPDKSDDDIDGDRLPNGKDDDCDGDGKGRSRDGDDDGDGLDDSGDDDDDNDGSSDDDENEVEVSLTPTASAPSGSRARAKVKQYSGGKIEFEIDGRGLAEGDYDVLVNGEVLGTLSMIDDDGRTEGEVDFETNPDKSDELPLPFNPFGLPVLIAKGGVTYFTGTVPTPTDVFVDDDGDDDQGGRTLVAGLMKPVGLFPEAEGKVEIQFGAKGVTGLEVEVEAIPAGAYDFIVGGVNRGTISVILEKGKLRGKLRFEVMPDNNGEILLDFPVAGKSMAVSQGGVTFLYSNTPSTF